MIEVWISYFPGLVQSQLPQNFPMRMLLRSTWEELQKTMVQDYRAFIG